MAPLGPVLEIVGKLRSTKSACCLEQRQSGGAGRAAPGWELRPPSTLTLVGQESQQGPRVSTDTHLRNSSALSAAEISVTPPLGTCKEKKSTYKPSLRVARVSDTRRGFIRPRTCPQSSPPRPALQDTCVSALTGRELWQALSTAVCSARLSSHLMSHWTLLSPHYPPKAAETLCI